MKKVLIACLFLGIGFIGFKMKEVIPLGGEIKNYTFTVKWNDNVYGMSGENVPLDKLEKQIGLIKYGDVKRSTPEGRMPYVSGGKIYKIKGVHQEKAIAVETKGNEYSKGVYIKVAFTESDAIAKVLKQHPQFPTKLGEIKEFKDYVGTNEIIGQITTKVERIGQETYFVSFTKDWAISFRNKKMMSYWKYYVTPDSVELIEFVDNGNSVR